MRKDEPHAPHLSDRPSPPAAMVVLTVRVAERKRAAFFRFITRAFRFYERPGGIHMSLFEDIERPGTFVEIASYDTLADYRSDQERVRSTPESRRILEEWRALLVGPPEVRLVKKVGRRR